MAQFHLALATVHHKHAAEDDNERQEDRRPEKTQRRPDGGRAVAVEDDDPRDDGIECDWNGAEEAGLREVTHDVDGDLRVEVEAEETHGGKEKKEDDVQDLGVRFT